MDQIDKNLRVITVKCKNFNEGFSWSSSLIFSVSNWASKKARGATNYWRLPCTYFPKKLTAQFRHLFCLNQRIVKRYLTFVIIIRCNWVLQSSGEISYIVKLATDSVESLEQFIDDSMQYGTPSTNIVLSSHEKR